MRFKGNAQAFVSLLPDDDRRSSEAVAGAVNAFFVRDKNTHRSVDQRLCIANALADRCLFIDQVCDKFCLVDLVAVHVHEVTALILQDQFDQLLHIVDSADRDNGKVSKLAADDQRLRIGIADTADADMNLILVSHAVHRVFKFCPELGVLQSVDRSVPAITGVNRHSAVFRAKVRMVIDTEIQIKRAIVLGIDAEKASHLDLLY